VSLAINIILHQTHHIVSRLERNGCILAADQSISLCDVDKSNTYPPSVQDALSSSLKQSFSVNEPIKSLCFEHPSAHCPKTS
jgi:hypothetical protein